MEEELFGNTMQHRKPVRFLRAQQGDWAVIVSFWFLTLLLALWPAKWVRRRKQGGNGMCRQCGYDLRATPAKCPECGLRAA
jgi:hypothetical protein